MGGMGRTNPNCWWPPNPGSLAFPHAVFIWSSQQPCKGSLPEMAGILSNWSVIILRTHTQTL